MNKVFLVSTDNIHVKPDLYSLALTRPILSLWSLHRKYKQFQLLSFTHPLYFSKFSKCLFTVQDI